MVCLCRLSVAKHSARGGHYTKRRKSYAKGPLRKPVASGEAKATAFCNPKCGDSARRALALRKRSFATPRFNLAAEVAGQFSATPSSGPIPARNVDPKGCGMGLSINCRTDGGPYW